MISPFIENAQDEHQRMYFHHIFEEEEQHLERLELFLPKLLNLEKSYDKSEAAERSFAVNWLG
jgi:rubrerythrin